MHELQEPHIATIKDAAQQLTGAKRRAFQARVALDDLNGSARRAEAVLGWSRRTVILGLHALRTGITCVATTSARGNRKTEDSEKTDIKWIGIVHAKISASRRMKTAHSSVFVGISYTLDYTRLSRML